jgi:serine/threonine protein kinase/tetratricopeptide (TPR) repeat protein
MSAKPLDEEALFHAARHIADPEARALFIEKACGEDAGLAERVCALVEMHEQEDDSADRPSAQTRGYEPVVERAGARVGPYRLMEQIGEGGFGLVFVAEQQEPVRRKVALKIIKPGMDSAQVIARFEAERQALALMDHPNIARVFDAGATDSGRPYFVMELVRGIPITEYCDKHQLSPHERLELFITVCQAIQHAHQKGIIHRDVKPSNVLVTSHDGKPVAKVIDFGVAKAIHQHLTERTIYTHFAQMIGTPLYMSPEQAEMSGLDIDTRSDIYSLGVLLYELLTGTTPLERQRLREAACDEVRRLIREEEPPKPSTRLSTSEVIAAVAAQRKMEPAKLSKLVRGDLDWITMKALEKDRTRRYETANGLARDIQRYLSDEPVEASPPSAVYRLCKLARKHRTALTTAAAFVVLLVAGAGLAIWQAVRATQAEALAVDANAHLDAANTELKNSNQDLNATNEALDVARKDAEKKRLQAEDEKQIALAVRTFLQHDLLRQADPTEQADRILALGDVRFETSENPTIKELLDRAAAQLTPEKIEAKFPRRPLIQAEILLTVGRTFDGVGELSKAIAHLERARALYEANLGPDDLYTVTSMNALACGYATAGKLDLAQPLFERTLKVRRAKLGPDHPETLESMNNLAWTYQHADRVDLALGLYEETLNVMKAKIGLDHVQTLNTMNNLGFAYQSCGKLNLALPHCEETLRLCKAKLGPDHPYTLTSMHHLAVCLLDTNKLAVALPLCQETLKLRKAKLGLDHPDTLFSMSVLAWGYKLSGEFDMALQLFEETLKLMQAKLGPDHRQTLSAMSNAAGCYWIVQRLDRSIPLLEEALKLREKTLGRTHSETQMAVADLGVNYRDAGRLDDALPLLEEAYRASRTIPSLRGVGTALLDAYTRAGKAPEAKTLGKDLVTVARESQPGESPQLAGVLAQYGLTLLQLKAFSDAEPLLRECLTIREKKQAKLWNTFNAQSMLGGALLGQKNHADAEPLLLKGYEGMMAREKSIPPAGMIRIPEAIDRLIELYTATNRPDKAKKWQAERAKYPAGTSKAVDRN